MANLTTDDVWRVLEKQNFMVVGMVSARGEARTAGVMPFTVDRTLWFTTNDDEWKARHIAAHPAVSVTVAIPKRVPLLPWIKVPAATITFSGIADIVPAERMPNAARQALTKGIELGSDGSRGTLLGIGIRPVGDFITYGVGVSVVKMRDTEAARGRAPSQGA
ncbi:pyridoxamine 5'-phosphate oxidase family protein [Mycetocola zhadangensis]|uniref:pyridoxamine 5'-phosphate oxidase family protein n=1 Tax=Mycetocola zhadangensis TaxID=1164595 RepID=UPI003A4DB779